MQNDHQVLSRASNKSKNKTPEKTTYKNTSSVFRVLLREQGFNQMPLTTLENCGSNYFLRLQTLQPTLPLLPATIRRCRLELLENITAGVGQDFGSELLRVQVFHAGIGRAVSAAIRHTAHHRRLIFTARDHGTTDCHVSAI